MTMHAYVIAVFAAVYAGMALGRWPGLRLDRTGIALLGALALYAGTSVTGPDVLAAIDFPTLFILFGLMILSAQFAACGFYDWTAQRLASSDASPAKILGFVILTGGGLSAILANDVVVFAMTPMLCAGLLRRGLDPRPYLIGLAGAANAGSAATVIGNPQNVLIGQVGDLDFWRFLAACAVPALIGLAAVYGTIWIAWRQRFALPRAGVSGSPPAPQPLDRWSLGKGVVAVVVLLGLFLSPVAQAHAVLLVAGFLLVSRRLATRQILSLVDWHLLVLFAALFVVTAAFAATGITADLLARAADAGDGIGIAIISPLTLAGSNTIGNVPLVMLVLQAMPHLDADTLYALAVFSTLAGNLFLVGSFANLIVVERAAAAGVKLSFADHARCGVPMTLLSFLGAGAWFWVAGAAF
jgi:Na+/H+ antiporter NhaD/arsenite permease-like protein